MEKFAPLNLNPDELVEYTPQWHGERLPDGRPRVPDGIMARMRQVTITQAWGVLAGEGFDHQYEGGWQCTHPGGVLCGRALTALYMPRRPDLRTLMEAKGERTGQVGDQISWPIDALCPGDVYVADMYGKVAQGPIIGDNLATAILARSGNGVVHDAAVRDLEGIEELGPAFTSFVRGWHPSYASPTIMLAGLNCPVRLGLATVMPGDVVLGKREGVIFIPPHLAEKVVTTSEIVRLRDTFGKLRLSEGRYTSGEIDRRWSDAIERDFSEWLSAHLDQLPVPAEVVQEYLQQRTW